MTQGDTETQLLALLLCFLLSVRGAGGDQRGPFCTSPAGPCLPVPRGTKPGNQTRALEGRLLLQQGLLRELAAVMVMVLQLVVGEC